jgi:hypothetical protein
MVRQFLYRRPQVDEVGLTLRHDQRCLQGHKVLVEEKPTVEDLSRRNFALVGVLSLGSMTLNVMNVREDTFKLAQAFNFDLHRVICRFAPNEARRHQPVVGAI